MLCGIFGNVSAADIERTVMAAPGLCSAGATVIWTRPAGCRFTAVGFDEVALDALATSTLIAVGVNRLRIGPSARLPAQPLFTLRQA